jgi:hypothetical protein
MGRIDDAACQKLADAWSVRLLNALDELGCKTWPPFTAKRGFLAKPQEITPYSLEGPVQINGQVCWAVAHVRRPSSFSVAGTLSPGECDFWLIRLRPGDPPIMTIEGAETTSVAVSVGTDWQGVLEQAATAGPKREQFYGNKGPLRHR